MDILNSKWNCAICIDSRQGGREENQDCYACSDTPIGFVAVVCDGMGGGPGGANASTLAVQAILQHLNSCNPVADAEAALKNAINNANRLLRQTIAEHAELRGMGTTCVVAVVKGKVATVAHVGDSRLYQVRGSRVVFRTADHSVVGEMVRRGELTEEDARRAANSNVITQALGISDTVDPEIDRLQLSVGDRLALCTDGIWGTMSEDQLVGLFCDNKSLRDLVKQTMDSVDMIGQTNSGYDNLTLGIVRITSLSQTIANTPANPQSAANRPAPSQTQASKRHGCPWMYVLGFLLLASVSLNAYMLVSSSGGNDNQRMTDDQWNSENTRRLLPPDQRNNDTNDESDNNVSEADEELDYKFLKKDYSLKRDSIRQLKQILELRNDDTSSLTKRPTRHSRLAESIKRNLQNIKESHKDKQQKVKNNIEFQKIILKDIDQLRSEYKRIDKKLSQIENQLKSKNLTEVNSDGTSTDRSRKIISNAVNVLDVLPVYPADANNK